MKFSTVVTAFLVCLAPLTASAQEAETATSPYLIDAGDVFDLETADIETIATNQAIEIIQTSQVLSDADKQILIDEILDERALFLEAVVEAVEVRRTYAKRDLTYTRNVGISASVAPAGDDDNPAECPTEIFAHKRDLTFTRNIGISAHIDAGR